MLLSVNPDDGEVGILIRSDDLGVVDGGVAGELDLDLGGVLDDVIVGEDQALFVNDNAGAEAALSHGALIGKLEEAVEEVAGVIALPLAALAIGMLALVRVTIDYLGGGDIHHCAGILLDDSGKTAGKLDGARNGQRGCALSAHGGHATAPDASDNHPDTESGHD